jgi:hypothetical protein
MLCLALTREIFEQLIITLEISVDQMRDCSYWRFYQVLDGGLEHENTIF